MRAGRLIPFALIAIGVAGLSGLSQQGGHPETGPFKGVTTNGTIVPDLFPIKATGVSTAPVKAAAEQFLSTLSPEQRQKTVFPVNDEEWRRWHNIHRYARQGVSFKEMNDVQREAA